MVQAMTPSAGRWPFTLLLLLGISLVVRVWRLDQKNLWLDEAWSWNQTTKPVWDLIVSVAGNIHPPLYYVLLKGWTWIFGDSPAGLRSLSVLASLLALLLAFRLGSGYLPRPTLYAVLLWLAVSPHMLFYAQEARMYALTTAAVLGTCVAYRKWVDSGFTRARSLAAVAIWGCAALYLHYFAALVLVAMWAHLLKLTLGTRQAQEAASQRRRPLLAWALTTAAIAVTYLPWGPIAVRQISRGQAWRAPVTLLALPGYAADLFHELCLGYYGTRPLITAPAVAVMLVAFVGIGRLVVHLFTKVCHERDVFLALVCFVPPVLGLAALPKTGRMQLSRYLAFVLPLLIIGIARGLSHLWRDHRIVIAASVLGAVASLPSTAAYFADPVRDSDVRPIVAYLDANASRGDFARHATVLVAPGNMTLCTTYASRNLGLAYGRVDQNVGLWPSVAAAARAAPSEGVWVIVDYRWQEFTRLREDARLREVDVPGGHPDKIRLFRARIR